MTLGLLVFWCLSAIMWLCFAVMFDSEEHMALAGFCAVCAIFWARRYDKENPS